MVESRWQRGRAQIRQLRDGVAVGSGRGPPYFKQWQRWVNICYIRWHGHVPMHAPGSRSDQLCLSSSQPCVLDQTADKPSSPIQFFIGVEIQISILAVYSHSLLQIPASSEKLHLVLWNTLLRHCHCCSLLQSLINSATTSLSDMWTMYSCNNPSKGCCCCINVHAEVLR